MDEVINFIALGINAVALCFLIPVYFMIKEHNEQLVELTRHHEHESFKIVQENAQLKASNARLRRLLTGEVDDPDLFPARQSNIVSFKRGTNEKDDGGPRVS